jgi:hypothetical protein
MSVILVSLALASVAPQAPRPLAKPPTSRDLAFLQDFSRCVVANNAKGAASAIDANYREAGYRSQLDTLVQSERVCLMGGTLRIRGVVLAGFLAEALIEKKLRIADPVGAVVYNPLKPPLTARDEGEVIALCTVRAKPVDTVALLGTVPGSTDESTIIRKLVPHVQFCTAQGVNARFNKPGLRAILALAFRRLALQTSQNQGGA